MTPDTLIALSIVAVAAVLVVRGGVKSWRDNLAGGSACGSCGGCEDGKGPVDEATECRRDETGRLHLPILGGRR